MSFYSEAAATAAQLLTEFGQPLSLSYVASSTYDPATSTATPQPSQKYTAYGVMFDYDTKFVDQTMILQGDKHVYLSTKGLSVVPKAGMILTDGAGETYTIISVKPLAPALVTVLYEMQVRH